MNPKQDEQVSHGQVLPSQYALPPKNSSSQKKRGFIIIFISLFLMVFPLLMHFVDTLFLNPIDNLPTAGHGIEAPKQSPVLGILMLLTGLLWPLWLILFIIGIVKVSKPHKQTAEQTTSQPQEVAAAGEPIETAIKPKPASTFKAYLVPNILLVITAVMFIAAWIVISSVRSGAGYSGSEGELGALPFLFSGFVCLIITIVAFIIVRHRISKL